MLNFTKFNVLKYFSKIRTMCNVSDINNFGDSYTFAAFTMYSAESVINNIIF